MRSRRNWSQDDWDDYGDYLYHKRKDEEAELMFIPKENPDENGTDD